MTDFLSNIDRGFLTERITQMMENLCSLYLVIKKDSENRAKITIKTILTALHKRDMAIVNRYYELFSDEFNNAIKLNNTEITEDKKKIINVAFGLLVQLKLLIDSSKINDVVEKGFYTLEHPQLFYLFKTLDGKVIKNASIIENKDKFITYYQNVFFECAESMLKNFN